MTLLKAPICLGCTHFHDYLPGSADGQMQGSGTCDAFPNAIPQTIWRSAADHRQPILGDGGVQYKPKDERAAAYAERLFAPQPDEDEEE